jgi:alanyl-tRNA synthetase
VDLTADALRAQDISVDMKGFEEHMEAQKAQARAAWSGSGDQASEKLWFDLEEEFGATEFLGYDREESEARILALIKDGDLIQEVPEGEKVQILTNQTPFYAESGGQVGDTGLIISERGTRIRVIDTQKKLGKLTIHEAEVEHGVLKNGESVKMSVDKERRQNIRAHHSVTHLLHEALREVVGDHVAQKGSLQHDTRTRFDISHHTQITPEQMQAIERMVNDEIRANSRVETQIMPLEDALHSGAQALFGEKYGEEVRVVSMGRQLPGANKKFSVELCGGTHVSRTGEIGLFKVIGESAVSAGVRRIEAVAGPAALDYLNHQDHIVHEASMILKASPAELPARVKSLQEERRKLENQVAELRRQVASGGSAGSANDELKEINGVKF